MVKLENLEDQERFNDDEDEEIPEEMLPLLNDEVDFVQDFIEEEVTRRLQEIEDQEDDQEE